MSSYVPRLNCEVKSNSAAICNNKKSLDKINQNVTYYPDGGLKTLGTIKLPITNITMASKINCYGKSFTIVDSKKKTNFKVECKTGDVTVYGNLCSNKNSTVKGDGNVYGNLCVNKNLTVKGSTILNGLTINGLTNLNNNLNVTGLISGDLIGDVVGDMTGNVMGNVMGNVTGDLTGDVTGNVYGDVTGDLSGDVTGNVVGNVLGNLTGDVMGNVIGDLIGNVLGNVTGDLSGTVTGDLIGDVTGNVTGNVNGDVTGDLTGRVITPYQSLVNVDGVLSLSHMVTVLRSNSNSGDYNVTLGDGVDGQHKYLIMTEYVNDSYVLVGDNVLGNPTLTFNGITQSVHMMYITGQKWVIVNNNGVTIS